MIVVYMGGVIGRHYGGVIEDLWICIAFMITRYLIIVIVLLVGVEFLYTIQMLISFYPFAVLQG
jgi:hypothetical protein